mgnify:CR=1 FL=1
MILQTRSKKMWQTILTKENYNTLVTIQKPMRNKYSMEERMRQFSELNRVSSMFYSVERNADLMGYHIHLMFNAFNCNIDRLAFALDIKQDNITYYKPIDSKSSVSRYVTKHMKGDLIHYNFYSK